MFPTLKVIQDHVDVLKSTQEKLIKDYGTLMNEVTGLKETLREENYRINIMEERTVQMRTKLSFSLKR